MGFLFWPSRKSVLTDYGDGYNLRSWNEISLKTNNLRTRQAVHQRKLLIICSLMEYASPPLSHFKVAWYDVHLRKLWSWGELSTHRVLTVLIFCRCSIADMRRFSEGQLPVCAPSKSYSHVIIRGLLEHGLSEEEATAYVKAHSPPYDRVSVMNHMWRMCGQIFLVARFRNVGSLPEILSHCLQGRIIFSIWRRGEGIVAHITPQARNWGRFEVLTTQRTLNSKFRRL